MTKWYCDKCGKELKEGDHWRVKRKLGRFEIEVMHSVDGTWNAGNLCHECIVEIVNDGKTVK